MIEEVASDYRRRNFRGQIMRDHAARKRSYELIAKEFRLS